MTVMSAAYMRKYRQLRAASRAEAKGGLLAFQQTFVDAVEREKNPIDIAALSVPRGGGKSWLCGRLVARSLTPGDALHEASTENILVSASRSQAAIVLEFARQSMSEDAGIRWKVDGATHLETRASVRIISSDARRAFGLGARTRLIIGDEPGSWSPTAGRRLFDAIVTSLGKRRTQLILIGTLAPAPLVGPASWWPAYVGSGSGDGRHVTLLQADSARWTDFDEVLRVNPVADINPHLRRALEREHRAALVSERAARTFKQYRLNIPGDPVDQQPLITAAEWQRVCARPVPAVDGAPVVGIDLGGSRSWSAAAAIWPSGRVESWAIAPGLPGLDGQEREDQVPENTYVALTRTGLTVDAGRAVPGIGMLLSRIWSWKPDVIVCDPYRVQELHQTVAGRTRIVERARGGGESTSNVQALRALLLDSACGVTESSRDLLGAAFAQTSLVIDGAGITKVTKARAKRSRDDAAAALLLAAGEQARRPAPVELRGAVISRTGRVTWL